MNQNLSSFDKWLDRTRNGSHQARNFWLYSLTTITMALVVFLWSGYMSFAIPSISPVQTGPEAAAQKVLAQAQDNAHIDVSSGLALVARALGLGVSRSIAYVKDIVRDEFLGSASTVIVKPKHKDFIVENLDAIPQQILPVAE